MQDGVYKMLAHVIVPPAWVEGSDLVKVKG